jgi:YHS domain-containing protein
MEFLGRIIEFILWAIVLTWFVRKLLGWLARPARSRQPGAQAPPAPPRAPIPLERDPWCGTFVSPEISVTLEQEGRKLHFCSEECRALYQASGRHAARA